MSKKKADPIVAPTAPASDELQSAIASLTPAHAKPNEFLIPLANISGPKFNHRQVFLDIDELADSLTEHGQEEAIKVRPVTGKLNQFEVVYGERRWRAFHVIAKRGQRDTAKIMVTCKVEVLNDRGVVVAQAVENLDRSDPHPLEEALIYEKLLSPAKDGGQGMTMFVVMQRLRKPVERITDRLELLKLCDDARTAYLADRFTDAHALLIARIPDPSMQMRFVRDILSLDNPAEEGRLMSVEQARKHVRRYFMLPLADAPFPTEDEFLCGGSGPCGKCPRNTRTQTVLFRDIEPEQAFCTDIQCFEQKADVHWGRVTEQARANGQDVLTDADAKAVWPWAGSEVANPHGSYVPLSQVSYEFEPTRTFAELVEIVESVGHVVRRAIARRPGTHTIVELLTAEDARTVVHQARECLAAAEQSDNGESTTPASDDAAPAPKGEQDASREERWKQMQEEAARSKREQTQQYRAAMSVFVSEFASRAAAELPVSNVIRAMARRIAQNCLVDTAREVASRRGLKPNGNVQKDRGMRAEPEAALLAFVDRTEEDGALLALIFELILAKDAGANDPFVGLRDVLAGLAIREEDARQGRTAPEQPPAKKQAKKRTAAKQQARAGA